MMKTTKQIMEVELKGATQFQTDLLNDIRDNFKYVGIKVVELRKNYISKWYVSEDDAEFAQTIIRHWVNIYREKKAAV